MSVLADLLSHVFERRDTAPDPDVQKRPIADLADDLLTTRGNATGDALAHSILTQYASLADPARLAFFAHLTHRMDIDPGRVRDALVAYETDPTRTHYRAFMAASEPPRQELIRRLNRASGATGQLVAIRADLLRLMADQPGLAALDVDFAHLFGSWFNRGFLVLKPISWESPASILEKIIAYEAVHAIDSWPALRRRLHPADRRCFAFFHPSMPSEPLIFVEVALTTGIPSSVDQILAEDRAQTTPAKVDTATFYSISNCQAGLARISFGNSLIKQVVADLSRDLPQITTFCTLSPIPGLTAWLKATGQDADNDDALKRLAARYLLTAQSERGDHRDPVARFHLGNGAEIHAIHTGADLSQNGQAQSGGVMVNYLYDMSSLTQNHDRFAVDRTIAAAPAVRALADA